MFDCDLHVHSIRSTCGFHTLLEIVSIMKKRGIKGFALTDHGPALGTPRSHFSVLIRRVPSVIDDIRVFKGIEASVMTVDGDIDLPQFAGISYEAILAGLHQHHAFEVDPGKKTNTRALINAMRKNPSIKVITHPYHSAFSVDLDALTDVAIETGTALEVNNAHIKTDKIEAKSLARMLELAKAKGTKLAVNSDGHIFHEMGNFENAVDYLKPFDIDIRNIVNRTLESTLEFLELEA